MKTYLLPCEGQFYKANMHSHSTLSDGKFTPEELKERYLANGYSVFAYSEHTVLHDLRALDDERFLTLPSYELDFTSHTYAKDEPRISSRYTEWEVIHMNLYATDPDAAAPIDKSDLLELPWLERLNAAVHRAKEQGFLVSLNHPHWSKNPPETYLNLPEIDFLEIINGAANRSSGLDFVPHVQRDIEMSGKRIVVVGGDDNHTENHLHLAYTMIKASELSRPAILEALKNGHCYASAGPEIKELYVEDGAVHIKTSEASAIRLNTATRRKSAVLMYEQGNVPITEAVLPLHPADRFFHVIVRDLYGRPAATQVYHLSDYDFEIKE